MLLEECLKFIWRLIEGGFSFYRKFQAKSNSIGMRKPKDKKEACVSLSEIKIATSAVRLE